MWPCEDLWLICDVFFLFFSLWVAHSGRLCTLPVPCALVTCRILFARAPVLELWLCVSVCVCARFLLFVVFFRAWVAHSGRPCTLPVPCALVTCIILFARAPVLGLCLCVSVCLCARFLLFVVFFRVWVAHSGRPCTLPVPCALVTCRILFARAPVLGRCFCVLVCTLLPLDLYKILLLSIVHVV